MESIPAQLFSRAVSIMPNEACFGPAGAGGSWFTDVEPESGILGVPGMLSQIAHGAWHPGASRQALGLVVPSEN